MVSRPKPSNFVFLNTEDQIFSGHREPKNVEFRPTMTRAKATVCRAIATYLNAAVLVCLANFNLRKDLCASQMSSEVVF